MEICQERLEREQFDLVTTAPTVTYHLNPRDGNRQTIITPAEILEDGYDSIEELMAKVGHGAESMVGAVMQLATERRGEYLGQEYLAVNAGFKLQTSTG